MKFSLASQITMDFDFKEISSLCNLIFIDLVILFFYFLFRKIVNYFNFKKFASSA